MSSKDVFVYVCTYSLDGMQNTPDAFFQRFQQNNLKNNVRVETSSGDEPIPLLLLVDKVENRLVFGRFMKLRAHLPSVINTQNGIERDIVLAKAEDVKEQSHFLIDTEKRLIFAEYNCDAIRHFSSPMEFYLNELLNTSSNHVLPVPDSDSLERLRKESIIKTFEVAVAQHNLRHLEGVTSRPPSEYLRGIADGDETIFKVTITKSKRRGSTLNKGNAIETVTRLLKHKEDIKKLKITGKNALYDLLKDNLVKYKISVEHPNRRFDTANFYENLKKLWDSNADSIRTRLN